MRSAYIKDHADSNEALADRLATAAPSAAGDPMAHPRTICQARQPGAAATTTWRSSVGRSATCGAHGRGGACKTRRRWGPARMNAKLVT